MNTSGKWFALICAIMMHMVSPSVSECDASSLNEGEIRAVWLHQTLFDKEEMTARIQITDLFNDYAETGINNLYCYYTLQEENHLPWDYLQVIIEEGHKRGIGIHPVFCPGHEVDLEQATQEHPDWLIRDRNGNATPHLNLALPQVRKYWMEKIARALEYDIDGIHLDYMRYPLNQGFSYDSLSCSLFKQVFGSSPFEISNDSGSMLWCEWIKWNEKQITAFVREVHQLIQVSGKKVLLGADVFPSINISPVEIGQHWIDWAQEGIIDFVCPMLYTNNPELFGEYLGEAVAQAGTDCRVFAGIGIVTSHNRITPEIFARQLAIAREKGAQGVVFFSGFSLSDEFRKILKSNLL